MSGSWGANSAGFGLRPGQAKALQAWGEALDSGRTSELVVVPVGYGKTVIGVGSFAVARERVRAEACLYLTPTDVLRTQVYGGVERALGMLDSSIGVRKALADNAAPQRLTRAKADFVVATYQQVVAAPGIYQRMCESKRVHLVCDEAHHLGERGRWAAVVSSLGAKSTLLLSATPVRLDRDAIAGARYVPDTELGGEVIDPLIYVSMRQAWKEGRILKRLAMQMKDYSVELRDATGAVLTFTASEMAELPDFDQRCVREQLRWNEDYVEPLVREFARALIAKQNGKRGTHQGLVFAATTEHANHLYRLFGRWHSSLRCAVVHSADIGDAENERRMTEFHAGRYDVLIQVRKASEGFDAPAVSVLLKLDAVHSREPLIQQLGRGLRYNHGVSDRENVLHVFIGRDPRLQPLIEQLEREAPPVIERMGDSGPVEGRDELPEVEFEDEEERTAPEVVDVVEAGDAYLDHTGRFVEGQQMTMFGVKAPPPPEALRAPSSAAVVVDIEEELREAVDYCRSWTNRAARERGRRYGGAENAHAALNAEYARESGRRGTLATAAEYREKGDWMKRRYLAYLG
ncbi:MAG: DEAD/DEAH box helicase [Tepidiformaceae bacterium]